MTELELSDLNRGKTADYILGLLKPTLHEMEESILGRLKMTYRDGTVSESKLLALAAELCTLDDIENRLRAQIENAKSISQKNWDGGKVSE